MVITLWKAILWARPIVAGGLTGLVAAAMLSTAAPAAGYSDGGGVQIAESQQQHRQGQQVPYGGQLQYRPRDQKHYQQGGPPPYPQGRQYDWNAYRPGHPPAQWQQYHQKFDPRPYQWNQYADHSYRWQPYVRPYGWNNRRWTYGEYLPRAYWGQNYWLPNYWTFGLVNPPYGYVWVRYGNDALMVNIITGQILGSVYWLFY